MTASPLQLEYPPRFPRGGQLLFWEILWNDAVHFFAHVDVVVEMFCDVFLESNQKKCTKILIRFVLHESVDFLFGILMTEKLLTYLNHLLHELQILVGSGEEFEHLQHLEVNETDWECFHDCISSSTQSISSLFEKEATVIFLRNLLENFEVRT
jgi:hypothetical protein